MRRFGSILAVVAFFATTVPSAAVPVEVQPPPGHREPGVIRVPQDYGILQQAVDAAIPGDTILVRGGRHGAVRVEWNSDLTIRGKKSPALGGLAIENCADVRVRGFVVEGSIEAAAVRLRGSARIRLEKCVIRDCAETGIELEMCPAAVIRRCDLTRIGRTGIRVVDSDDVRVEKNEIARVGDWAVALEGTSARSLVRKNDVTDAADGMLGRAGDDNRFEKNDVRRVRLGYLLQQGVGGVLYKNRATDAETGLLVLSSSGPGENRVERNKIVDSGFCGIGISGFSSSDLARETVQATVPVTHFEEADVTVGASPLSTTFFDGTVRLARCRGLVRAVTLAVRPDLSVSTTLQNPSFGITDTWWYTDVDAAAGPLSANSHHEGRRNYPSPRQTRYETWHDVLAAESSADSDLEGFQGAGFVDIALTGKTDLYSWWNAVDHFHSGWQGSILVSLTYDYVPLPQGTVAVVRNKVKGSAENGVVVQSTGVTFERNKVDSCGECGFLVALHGNEFRDNNAKRSGMYDLMDEAGGNEYWGNRFGTTSVAE